MTYHPVFLRLDDRPVVVVGGGGLALAKARELVEAGARVTVVAAEPASEIASLASAGRLTLVARDYQDGDLAGAWLAFAAAGDPGVHRRVKAEAERSKIWLNAVDDVPNCSFIAGSVHRQGNVIVSVTTGGACPALAVRLRQTIGRLIGPEHARFARMARSLRREIAARIPDFERRRRFWYSLVDSSAIGLFRSGRERDARRRAHRLLAEAAGNQADRSSGRVVLVGAGPGHPGLITALGLTWLRIADTVVHDRLVSPDLLREARPDARLIDAGKTGDGPSTGQDEIHEILVREAREGRLVVRLKGGDPFVFGRGAEEVEALETAGIACEVVSGVTSAVAGPAAAGIPVTRRGVAGSFAVVTGREAGGGPPIDWPALAGAQTLVVLMGRQRVASIADRLIAAGRSPDTPAAAIARATLPGQRTVRTRLGDLARAVVAEALPTPAILVIGDVVGLDRPAAQVRLSSARA